MTRDEELKMKIDEAIKKERLSDELRMIQSANVEKMQSESYEDNLRRRAALRLRENEILKELYGW